MGTMKTYLAAEKKLVAATLAAYTVRSLGQLGYYLRRWRAGWIKFCWYWPAIAALGLFLPCSTVGATCCKPRR